MTYHVEIVMKKAFREPHGEHVRHSIVDIGIKSVPVVKFSPVYRIEGELTPEEIETISSRLLIDPVTETFVVTDTAAAPSGKGKAKPATHEIEVWLKPGVTDTVAESVVKAVRDLGIEKDLKVKTGQKYVFKGAIETKTVRQIAERLLVNPMVQEYHIA